MLKRLFAAAFILATSSLNASASDCWSNVTGTQADCGVVNMYLDANSKAAPVTTTTPLPLGIYGNGTQAQVSLDGSLSVNTPASPQFQDSFSTTLDTTTNWTLKTSTGTAATASGQLVIGSSTTASAWGGVSTQQTFAPVGVGSQVWGVLASFTVLAQANSSRVFGVFTVPTTPTTAVPVTDGYIYRLDGTGALFAEIWSNGAAVSSTNVTTACLPAANFPGIFAIIYRANLVQFTCGSSLVVNQAPILGINPANQVLPLSALSIAGSTPPAASAVMNLSALALGVISPATIKSAAQAPTDNDPAEVVDAKQYLFDGLNWNKSNGLLVGTVGAPGADVVTVQAPITAGSAGYPAASTPTTNSATGTTGAVVGTLAAVSAKTTYLCGFTITSDATAALAGTATVTGTIGGTMSFIQNVGSATAAGILTQTFSPCIPGSAVNTAIAVNSVAAGTGGNTAVSAWGFTQ